MFVLIYVSSLMFNYEFKPQRCSLNLIWLFIIKKKQHISKSNKELKIAFNYIVLLILFLIECFSLFYTPKGKSHLIKFLCGYNAYFSTAFSKMPNEDFKYRIMEVISVICKRNESITTNLQVSIFICKSNILF